MLYKTFTTTPSDIEQKWWIIDAEGHTLGRLAARIAPILRGKHKTTWSPHLDMGDYVVVINVDKISVTGSRMDDKMYYRHSKFQGGLTEISLRDNLRRFPDRPLREAVKGMLPKNQLGRNQLKKLKLYAGTEHPHAGQKPQVLEIEKE